MEEPRPDSRTQVRVRYGEVDRMGVVYHAHYLPYFEQGRTEWLRERGLTYRAMEEAGHLLVVVDVGVRYHAPAHYDDLLTLTTTLAEERPVRLRFEYDLRRGDKRIASGHTVLACTDTKGRLTRVPPLGRDTDAPASKSPSPGAS